MKKDPVKKMLCLVILSAMLSSSLSALGFFVSAGEPQEDKRGGGFFISSDGNVVMSGGLIRDNGSSAVFLETDSRLDRQGGDIRGVVVQAAPPADK